MDACAGFAGTPEAAWDAHRGLEHARSFVEESHFGVSIRACRDCGQRYLHVFSERIDFAGGNDPQAWKVMAVAPDEEAALAALDPDSVEGAVLRLSPRRCLDVYHPSDGEKILRWTEGPGWIMPHD
jgi:hypothetical protein